MQGEVRLRIAYLCVQTGSLWFVTSPAPTAQPQYHKKLTGVTVWSSQKTCSCTSVLVAQDREGVYCKLVCVCVCVAVLKTHTVCFTTPLSRLHEPTHISASVRWLRHQKLQGILAFTTTRLYLAITVTSMQHRHSKCNVIACKRSINTASVN